VKKNKPGKFKGMFPRPEAIKNRSKEFIFRDFSTVEDSAEAFKLIQELANNAGKYAAAEARALGLGTVYVRDNKLERVFAKGESVAITPRINRASFYVKYNPATILHAIKK
jgi:hypothetical protein